AAAASRVFTVMRTISEPARASCATCIAVAKSSAVSVLVMDCTTTGAISVPYSPPPTRTLPTRTWRVLRRKGKLLCVVIKRQTCHIDTGMGLKINGAILVTQLHGLRIADHELERRQTAHRLAAVRGAVAAVENAIARIAHFDPG